MEFNLDVNLNKGISPDMFFFCKMKIESKYGSMFTLLNLIKSPEHFFSNLMESKLLLSTDKYNETKLPEDLVFNMKNLRALFSESEDDLLFWEIFSMYPIKVPNRDGGSRPLRAADVHAQDTQYCKIKYTQLIKKDKTKHEFIVMCLKAELWVRKKSNSFQFMQEFKTWIRSHGWDKYSYAIEDVRKIKMKQSTGTEGYAENEF